MTTSDCPSGFYALAIILLNLGIRNLSCKPIEKAHRHYEPILNLQQFQATWPIIGSDLLNFSQ